MRPFLESANNPLCIRNYRSHGVFGTVGFGGRNFGTRFVRLKDPSDDRSAALRSNRQSYHGRDNAQVAALGCPRARTPWDATNCGQSILRRSKWEVPDNCPNP